MVVWAESNPPFVVSQGLEAFGNLSYENGQGNLRKLRSPGPSCGSVGAELTLACTDVDSSPSTPAILALGRWRLEAREFKTTLNCVEREASRDYKRPCLKNQQASDQPYLVPLPWKRGPSFQGMLQSLRHQIHPLPLPIPPSPTRVCSTQLVLLTYRP